jgi:hypothetical protein
MANETLNIPDKIKVGYQNRNNTYTGKLAYVVYINKKGVIAKEKSWEGWRDKDIDPQNFDNVPTEGFVLNKKVGGVENSWGWNVRKTYSRVYDPRGFEFEISIDNLLFILQECDCTKGKGLEGKFVYAWAGKDLILLPVSSEDYKLSRKLLDNTEKITIRSLVVGALYKGKDGENLVYIGKHKWFAFDKKIQYGYPLDTIKVLNSKKIPVFYDANKDGFWGINRMNDLYYCKNKTYVTADQVTDYIDLYKNTFCGGADKIKSFVVKDVPKSLENFYSLYLKYYVEDNRLYQLSEIYNEFHKAICIFFKNNELTYYYYNRNEIIIGFDHPLYQEYKENKRIPDGVSYNDWQHKFNFPCAVLENDEICPIRTFAYGARNFVPSIKI